MSIKPAPRTSLRAPPAAALLLGGALAIAGLSLLLPSSPSYDPYAWLVWGRELTDPARTFGLAGGPSWKPLPAIFTAPFALLLGSAAPAAWLVVVRTATLTALAGGWALGARLAGRTAGALAVLALLLLAQVPSLALRGASEPLLIACVLWAVERHLAGRRGQAYALGIAASLIRPEAFAFATLYALWRWSDAGGRERVLLSGGLVLVPLAWIGPPAVTGDALSASSYATAYDGAVGSDPAWTALRRGLGLAIAPVWVLALAAVVLRPRDRTVRALALGAAAWLGVVAAMTVAGYPGLARFMLPTAAIASVLAAVAAVDLGRRFARERPVAAWIAVAALAAALAAFAAGQVASEATDVREATRLGRMQAELTRAVAAAGGPAVVLACGSVATNRSAQTALAWKLGAGLDRVAQQLRAGGVLFRGPHSRELGLPAGVTFAHARARLVAHVGVWDVLAVASAARPLPAGCRLDDARYVRSRPMIGRWSRVSSAGASRSRR